MTTSSQCYITSRLAVISKTANNFNHLSPRLCAETPKIRIKNLEELQEPSIIKSAKDNEQIKYMLPNFNHLNKVDSTGLTNISSSITDQKHENVSYDNQAGEKSLPIDGESLFYVSKLELRENLMSNSLKKRPALYSNRTGLSTDVIEKRSQHSGNKNLNTEKRTDKFITLSQNKNINLPSPRKEDSDIVVATSLHPREEVVNGFEFVDLSEDPPVDVEKDKETASPSYVGNMQDMSVINHNTDYESKRIKYSNPNKVKSKMSSTNELNEFDSTGLKNGIIKASRTLVNTQKELKTLENTIARDASLPAQHAVKLLRKFRNIFSFFNKSLEKIDQSIKNDYKDMFLGCDTPALLRVLNNTESHWNDDQVGELITNAINYTNNVENSSPLYKIQPHPENIENKDITPNRRKKRRLKAYKSDDEELDKTYVPFVQPRIKAASSRKRVSQRPCQDRKYVISNELY